MKAVFALMLLVNAGFLVWNVLLARTPEAVELTPVPSRSGHVNRLLLLEEIDAGQLRERSRTVVASVKPPPKPVADTPELPDVEPMRILARSCYSIGPLTSEDETLEVEAWLRERGGASILRLDERRERSLFWVYLPPFPSREAAHDAMAEMQERGVEDMIVIRRGDTANAVSLGLYSRQVSVDRRLAELRTKGYEASVLPSFSTAKGAWFDVEFSGEFDDPFDFPQELFAEAFPEMSVTPQQCG